MRENVSVLGLDVVLCWFNDRLLGCIVVLLEAQLAELVSVVVLESWVLPFPL